MIESEYYQHRIGMVRWLAEQIIKAAASLETDEPHSSWSEEDVNKMVDKLVLDPLSQACGNIFHVVADLQDENPLAAAADA
jgi:hypothetical protein